MPKEDRNHRRWRIHSEEFQKHQKWGVVVLKIGEVERSEKVFNALGAKLAESYRPAQFSIHAFCQAQGWVRNGPPEYVKHPGEFLMAEVHPPKAPAYRFMIQREDALDIGKHETALMFIQLQNFPDYEREDGKRYYYQFIPQLGDSSGELKAWAAGERFAE
jgi:hypothetical protein